MPSTHTAVDPVLLDLLACPDTHHSPLLPTVDGRLECVHCGRLFDVEDGIPVLLLDRCRSDAATAPES
jgi:uncharacterized protein YbaR (Trm112 family)